MAYGTTNAERESIMAEPHGISCYQYVTRSYQDVSTLLRREPLALLQRATTSASARAKSLATSLRLSLGGLEISVDVRLHVRRIREDRTIDGVPEALRIELTWDAMKNPGLFPSMLAELVVRRLSETETQVEILGSYWTPMGSLGTAIDAAVGHRLAKAVLHRFLVDLVEQLHSDLPGPDSVTSTQG